MLLLANNTAEEVIRTYERRSEGSPLALLYIPKT